MRSVLVGLALAAVLSTAGYSIYQSRSELNQTGDRDLEVRLDFIPFRPRREFRDSLSMFLRGDGKVRVVHHRRQIFVDAAYEGTLPETDALRYRGMCSVNSFNFTGSNSFVELVQAPTSATDAEAQFSVGNNINNISLYYRIFVRHGTLIGERKTSATAKVTLFSIPYDAVAHRFLRIRHNATTGAVLLETAPGSGGVPGAWTTRYTEAWHSSIPLTSVLIEMRGGTFKQETTPPGKVIFDNFAFALN